MGIAKSWVLLSALLLAMVSVAGCGKSDSNQPAVTPQATANAAAQAPATQPAAVQPLIPVVQMEDWCREHALPESICVQCNASLVEGYKSKGDWCAGHSVPESQCFTCNPALKGKFAAAYEAKYGKKPPAVRAEAEDHSGHGH